MTICSAYQIDPKNWAISLDDIGGVVDEDNNNNTAKSPPPVAIHYVIDNSYSMNAMTREVRDIFSEMVDSVATAPCSLTLFHQNATILSSNITSGKQMRDLELPPQGNTNIPAGIQKALQIIHGHEMIRKQRQQKEQEHNKTVCVRTHHILILLSDGEHNSGPHPESVLPGLAETIPDDTKLSVVIVGYSSSSNTSMGMLLKKSIETVAFQQDIVKTIYFATTRTSLQTALASLETGLNAALKGTFHEIVANTPTMVDNFGSEASSLLRVHLASGTDSVSLLCCADKPPKTLHVDGKEVPVVVKEEMSVAQLAELIQGLIDRTKIQVVASKTTSRALISKSVERLDNLVKVLEIESTKNSAPFKLSAASPKERLRQYRDIKALVHGARSLRNQVIDFANFSDGGSESQAAFLNGRDMKFANKALRRAAKIAGGVVDPKAERKAILKNVTSASFGDKLQLAAISDILANLENLSEEQFNNILVPRIRSTNGAHALLATELRHRAVVAVDEISDLDALGLSPHAKKFLESGEMADYLNDAFHGRRESYMSLASPWRHLEEWKHFGNEKFQNTWEMLMYAGFVGYPLTLERSPACQMNPFLLNVKGVRSSLADTASICCANQAEIPVYGPEAGEPVQDILVLIDPSMPRASKMICNNPLLAEKFTSATIARDLHMYTGINMRVALHCNSIFHLLSSLSVVQTEKGTTDEVIAGLRRAYMGQAYMCPTCGFGPVDHVACSDLMAHHGDQASGGTVVNNACPRCSWFSPNLDDWQEWDGTVNQEFIESTLKEQRLTEKGATAQRHHLSESKIDLVLRILYSIHKMAGASVKEDYYKLTERLATDEVPDLSPKVGVDGMSQVLLAILLSASDDDVKIRNSAARAFASETLLLSVIQEACARSARERFRRKSSGDKEKARKYAIDFITSFLGIEASTAPGTLDQMEAEPPVENVRLDCDDSYQLESHMAQAEIRWVRGIAQEWCHAWSFAKGLSKVLHSRKGGWGKIETDMETGYSNYQDVIQSLKEVELCSPRNMFGMDACEIQSLSLRLGIKAILSGAAEIPCKVNTALLLGGNSDDDDNDDDMLHDAAREMRMLIYFQRVQEKMAVWKADGEQAIFCKARAADIGQFCDMLGARHVHGFDKPTFWGLWRAAAASGDKARIQEFLRTANEEFWYKHGPAGTCRIPRTELQNRR